MASKKARRASGRTSVHHVTGGGGSQTLGVGGVATPPGAFLGFGNSGGLVITTSGSAGNPRVYDGEGRTVGMIEVTANYVTVQNFRIVANDQYGCWLDGNNIVFQNNDIKGVIIAGDGDLNAVTAFGNNIWILYNTAINFVNETDAAGSHTDFIQTWVSSSHPVASSNWAIVGNYATGPANPGRSDSIPSIHQGAMCEDYGQGGNSGGNQTGISGWFIADNTFGDSWGQCLKIDGGDNFNITRNNFIGDSDYACDFTSGTGCKFFSDNVVGPNYGAVGVSITAGAGPATPAYV